MSMRLTVNLSLKPFKLNKRDIIIAKWSVFGFILFLHILNYANHGRNDNMLTVYMHFRLFIASY